jgi:hypothetical protein
MVGGQIGSLTPVLSFGHNLCFNYPNGSCKPILNIYIPRVFQWYKELFNPMGFHPWNHTLKIRDSNSQIGSSLGRVKVHSLALSHILGSMKCDSWASFLARTFASPWFGREPKARVATFYFILHNLRIQWQNNNSNYLCVPPKESNHTYWFNMMNFITK